MSGFKPNFEPAAGTTWTESYNSVLSGNVQVVSSSLIYTPVTEIGSSVLSAAFGAGGALMHPAAVTVFNQTHNDKVTPNLDGSYTVELGAGPASGTITGPITGTITVGPARLMNLMYTVTPGRLIKMWEGQNGTYVQADLTPPPVIQTVTYSDGTSVQRICSASGVVTSPLQ
jgi:hypothetical protein